MIQRLKIYFRQLGPRIRFRLSASNSVLYLWYYRYIYKPKPATISAFLDAYSKKHEGRFTVVQIGANDGINHDPISKYIKRDGWQGILLEPQKDIHDKWLQKVYAKNTTIQTLCAALGAVDGTSTLYKVGWSGMRWASGLATFHRETLEEAYRSGHIAKVSRKYGLSIPTDEDVHIVEEDVIVISPPTLFARYQITDIALLQIDTEGFDFEVIKLFDISRTLPGAIVYENIHLSDQDAVACHKHLTANGYKVKDYGANTLAVHSTLYHGLEHYVNTA